MNEQLYKKKGRRYIPIGYSDGFVGFPSEGIWLVQHKDGCKSSECIIKYEELETAKPAVNLILGYQDKLIKYFKDNPHMVPPNETISGLVLNMLKEISK